MAVVDLFHAVEKENGIEGTSVRTDADSPEDFIEAFGDAIYKAVEHGGSIHKPVSQELVTKWMASGFEILAKLRGYKAEKVNERRILWSGDVPPYHAWNVCEGGKPKDESEIPE